MQFRNLFHLSYILSWRRRSSLPPSDWVTLLLPKAGREEEKKGKGRRGVWWKCKNRRKPFFFIFKFESCLSLLLSSAADYSVRSGEKARVVCGSRSVQISRNLWISFSGKLHWWGKRNPWGEILYGVWLFVCLSVGQQEKFYWFINKSFSIATLLRHNRDRHHIHDPGGRGQSDPPSGSVVA